jgi:hypothetical protein
MADYFLILDGGLFHDRIRPALGASWRQRSFEPCRALCADLVPAALEYARRYHSGSEEPLLARAAQGLEFDRVCWRAVVGEVLLFAAVEVPEFPNDLETLVCLLAPEEYRLARVHMGARCMEGASDRRLAAPIRQALSGSRDLVLGGAVYRPLDAGLNDRDDIERLATFLGSVRPEDWTVEDLRELREVEEADRADELDFAREWFPLLADQYLRMRQEQRVVVIERIY